MKHMYAHNHLLLQERVEALEEEVASLRNQISNMIREGV